MTGAILRGSAARGYRTTAALECPHCHQQFDVSGSALTDRQGPYLALWPVLPRAGEYTPAELEHVVNGPPSEHTGVALPQAPGRVTLPADPVPDFSGDR
jgi:hypothetical protein